MNAALFHNRSFVRLCNGVLPVRQSQAVADSPAVSWLYNYLGRRLGNLMRLTRCLQQLDVRGHMHRLNTPHLANPLPLTPAQKIGSGAAISSSRVPVADVDGEEFEGAQSRPIPCPGDERRKPQVRQARRRLERAARTALIVYTPRFDDGFASLPPAALRRRWYTPRGSHRHECATRHLLLGVS